MYNQIKQNSSQELDGISQHLLFRNAINFSDKSNIENYHPISQISNIAKAFEKKRIKKELVHYTLKLIVFYHTPNSVLFLVKVLNKQLQQYQAIFIIFSKIKKKTLVLQNVSTFGINYGMAQNLSSSYLKNRKQHVRINNELSEVTSIICGVPQGTTLSHTLFNKNINQIIT
ncbi:RNA-directed DNA polymerase from mobile element jockey, partial [Aphis craccivora]